MEVGRFYTQGPAWLAVKGLLLGCSIAGSPVHQAVRLSNVVNEIFGRTCRYGTASSPQLGSSN
jgi:hypothetical protein